VSLSRLQRNETLGLRATRIISGLNTFTCVVADSLPRLGFMQSVTVLHAKLGTELVVNLYSGWIVQLVNASFAWRTHKTPPWKKIPEFQHRLFVLVPTQLSDACYDFSLNLFK
jgi:hypothetical protein